VEAAEDFRLVLSTACPLNTTDFLGPPVAALLGRRVVALVVVVVVCCVGCGSGTGNGVMMLTGGGADESCHIKQHHPSARACQPVSPVLNVFPPTCVCASAW
jgi:hypothetical protein